jgi:hypothetical protein
MLNQNGILRQPAAYASLLILTACRKYKGISGPALTDLPNIMGKLFTGTSISVILHTVII